MKNYYLGLFAEYIVICIYKIKFYSILHHRFRNFFGEIDLIVMRGRTIVFVEVKARKSFGESSLKISQQNRITKAARSFLSTHTKYQNYDVRFDLVLIKPYKLPIIIKNAWYSNSY